MPTGVGHIQYPEQPPNTMDLELEDSYFLVKIHDAQAFFEANWLTRPGTLTVSSSMESSFQNRGSPLQSLHQITTLQRNVPCHLGLSVNMTDWLPARASDWLKITLNYTVLQDTAVRDLIEKMEKSGLSTKVSMVSADVAVAIKVSEIAGRAVSYLIGEGSQHSLFSMQMDLNLSNLKTGYYAVIGSQSDEDWPSALKLDQNGQLTDKNGHRLARHSYVILQVLARKRLGNEIARGQIWWELLEINKEIALSTDVSNKQERYKALENWRRNLFVVRRYAHEEHGYLLKEIEDIIRTDHIEVQEYLLPKISEESYQDDALPSEWQDVLGVRTEQDLRDSVDRYKEDVRISQEQVLNL